MMCDRKVCRRCGADKPAVEFSRKAKARDGLHSYCKPCRCAYQKEINHRDSPPKNAPQREVVWPRDPWEAIADRALMAWRGPVTHGLTGFRL